MHRRLAMRIAVQGDAHILVTEHLGDELRARTGGELERRAGVPEVMEAYRRQTGLPQQRGQMPLRNVAAVERRTAGVTEDQILSSQSVT